MGKSSSFKKNIAYSSKEENSWINSEAVYLKNDSLFSYRETWGIEEKKYWMEFARLDF